MLKRPFASPPQPLPATMFVYVTGAWPGALIAANERSRVWVFRVLIVTIVAELIYMVITR